MSLQEAEVRRFAGLVEAALPRLVSLTEAICRVPAPTGEEGERARFVAGEFERRGLSVEVDGLHNVVARRPGRGEARSMLVAAHLDTVFPAETALEVRREGETLHGPAIGDNCVAVACVIFLAELLDEAGVTTPGDLLLTGNVGEEGLGNLRGIRELVDRYEGELGAVVAVEGHGLGRLTHTAVGSRRIRVKVTGPGGHSWHAFGQPSAIHVLGRMVERIGRIEPPSEPPTTYNVGLIEGGTSVNTIAAEATAVIDMRSTDPSSLSWLSDEVEGMVVSERSEQVDVLIELLGERPAGSVPADAPIVEAARQVLEGLGLEAQSSIASTDANVPIARGLPALCVGITRGRDAHRVDEMIEIPPIALGMRQLLHLATAFPVGNF